MPWTLKQLEKATVGKGTVNEGGITYAYWVLRKDFGPAHFAQLRGPFRRGHLPHFRGDAGGISGMHYSARNLVHNNIRRHARRLRNGHT